MDENPLKPKFPPILDGVKIVPLVDSQGERIGTAVVKFENGKWEADCTLRSEIIKSLGVSLNLVHSTFLNGETLAIHAESALDSMKPATDFKAEFKKRTNSEVLGVLWGSEYIQKGS